MPDDRLFHKRLGHSEKVNKLTDFEDRVWRAYILSSDDFGVMRFAAVALQADHDYCAARLAKVVQKALERVRDLGLIVTFDHQGHTYCAQADWQDHQRVKHPRRTINPRPPDELLATFSRKTIELFENWPGKSKERLPEDSGNSSEIVVHLARAGARETAHANASGYRLTATEGGPGETTDTSRAGRFVERYRELHEQYIGVAYLGNDQTNYQEACKLVAAFDDAMLEKLVVYWLNDRDKFATEGTRTIAKMRSRASKYAEELKAKRLA